MRAGASHRIRVAALTCVISTIAVHGRAQAQTGECAAGWVLEGQLCYPACPPDFTGYGPLCRELCPPDHVDEGATCRAGDQVYEKGTQPRGGTHLTRTAYRELFVNFVRLYRAGAAMFAAPLTGDEKSFLRQFFPDRLVERVRVVTVPAIQLPVGVDPVAMTIGNDLVVIEQGRRTTSLLKHELVHVCQADRAGVDEFIRSYADQFVDSGYDYANIAFEREAYAFSDVAEPVSTHLGYCE